MPRQLRYHVPGEMYHVIARGNHQQNIFYHDSDYRAYLFYLEKYAAECAVVIHAFALMTNHVHLLLQEEDYPLGMFMKGVQQSYTQYINKRYEQSGHLFQGRYKSFRVHRDEYLLALVDYIHLNPVKAGMVKCPEDYRWSSYRRYHTRGSGGEGPAATKEVLALMAVRGRDTLEAQSSTLATTEQPKLICDPTQVERCKTLQPDLAQPLPLPAISAKVMHYTGISEKQFVSGDRSQEIATARWLFVWAASQEGYSMPVLARYLGQGRAAISKTLKTIQSDVDANGPWAARLDEFTKCQLRGLTP